MTSRIEPGILRLLRWYAGIRLGLLLLVLLANQGANPPEPPQFPRTGIVLFGLLFILLIWPAADGKLGKLYLPLAISLATIAPIFDATANISGRLEAGLPPNDTLVDYWIPFFLLFVPFILTAWQYRYRWVLAFSAGSTFLDLFALGIVFRSHDVNLEILAALVIARGFLFAFLGFFVSKLIARQRDLRAELQLHASTLEQLATGRERNRLARELHDTLAHSMTGTAVQLEAVQALWDEDPQQARRLLDEALEGTRSGLAEARRAIEDLRASPLEEHGLAGAIRKLAEDVTASSGVRVICQIDERVEGLPGDIEQTVYRVAEEAINNAVRHASPAEIELSVQIGRRAVRLTVADDGTGFDTQEVPVGRHGILGMRERAELVGGALEIDSDSGRGTRLELIAPMVRR